MILNIKKIEDKITLIKFANEELEISEKSEDWNTEGINKFLIKLASKTPNGEKIEIVYDKEENDLIYKHTINLFKEFVNEYNKLNVYKNENE